MVIVGIFPGGVSRETVGQEPLTLVSAPASSQSGVVRGPRRQIDLQHARNLLQLLLSQPIEQKGHQIVLPRLPEDHPVDRKRPLEGGKLELLATERQPGHVALD